MMMRRMVCAVIALFFIGAAYSQQPRRHAFYQFNVQSFKSAPVAEAKATIEKDEDLSFYNMNHYEYTLEPQKDKEYKQYQVIKLDGLSNFDIVAGMVTGTLERESRYIELATGKEQIAQVREALKDKADYVFVSKYEKEYFIAADGTYRYIDGRELVGDKKVKTYLEKGKPVTATTFFFALKDKGLIDSEISLRHFMSLSTEEKVSLLEMDIYAVPKETGSGQLSSELH